MDPIVAARPAAETFTRANYLAAVANGVDSFWVPDHLTNCCRDHCGFRNIAVQRSSHQRLTPIWSIGRLRLGVGVTDTGRRNPAVTARSIRWARVSRVCRICSPTAWTSRRRCPPSCGPAVDAAGNPAQRDSRRGHRPSREVARFRGPSHGADQRELVPTKPAEGAGFSNAVHQDRPAVEEILISSRRLSKSIGSRCSCRSPRFRVRDRSHCS